MTSLLNGILGGLVIGLFAGLVAQAVDTDPSATAVVVQAVTGRTDAAPRWLQAAIQIGYGGLGGGLLLAFELYVLNALSVPPSWNEALAVTVAWSALLFGVGAVLWRLGSEQSAKSGLRDLLTYHLVYGLGLGVWIRLTWIT